MNNGLKTESSLEHPENAHRSERNRPTLWSQKRVGGGGGSDVSFVVFQLAALGLVIKLMKKWIRLRVKKGEREHGVASWRLAGDADRRVGWWVTVGTELLGQSS